MAALAQLQGSCAFDTTLSEDLPTAVVTSHPKLELCRWDVSTERIQRLSLQSRLVSANVGGFLVTLKGAYDLDVQDTRLFHNVLTNPGHQVRVFPAKVRPTCCCNSKTLLKFEGKGNPSDLLLKHRSFQCANRKATGCSLTWWKEHPFILHDEGTIIIRWKAPSSFSGGGPLRKPFSGIRSEEPGLVHKSIEAPCIKCQTAGKVWMFWRLHQKGRAADIFGIGYRYLCGSSSCPQAKEMRRLLLRGKQLIKNEGRECWFDWIDGTLFQNVWPSPQTRLSWVSMSSDAVECGFWCWEHARNWMARVTGLQRIFLECHLATAQWLFKQMRRKGPTRLRQSAESWCVAFTWDIVLWIQSSPADTENNVTGLCCLILIQLLQAPRNQECEAAETYFPGKPPTNSIILWKLLEAASKQCP